MKIILSLIFLTLTTLTFGQTKESYKTYFDSLYLRGQYDELIVFFEKELVKYPNNEEILRSLGYVHIIKNNLELGEKYYNEALLVNPNCARCYLNIGRIYSNRGDLKKALEYMDIAIKNDPNDALLYSNRAFIKEKLDDKFGALKDHNIAIKLEPKNSDVYTSQGDYYSRSNFLSLAISSYSQAIELNNTNFIPYLNRAMLYYQMEFLDASCLDLIILKTLIENGKIFDQSAINQINLSFNDFCDSSRASYYYQRGIAFYNLNQYQKAINIYTEGIQKFPENGFLHSFIGNAYLAIRQYEKAIEFYTLSLKYKESILFELNLNPNLDTINDKITSYYTGVIAEIYLHLAQCWSNLGKYNTALQELNLGIDLIEKYGKEINEIRIEDFNNLKKYLILMNGK